MEPIPTTNCMPRHKKITSQVWDLFEKLDPEMYKGKMTTRAKCVVCGDKLACGGSSGTSHLKRHLESHVDAMAKGSDIRDQMINARSKSGLPTNFKFDNDYARQEIVDFIIRAELPFTFVDTHDFVGMIQRGFAPQFKSFSNMTCKRDVMKRFSSCKAELVAYFESFKGKVCFTSDMWSSRQKMGYMSLTAHFIDDEWMMHKRILSFKMVEYPHTGNSLASHVYEELLAWNLHEKAFTITLDNASNNDVLVEQLSNHLMLSDVSKRIFHVRCTCHILNLIVQDGLAVLSPNIEKITAIVRSMNSSIKRHELWVKCCADLGVSKRNIDNDVPHRWNSTYELLKVAVKYRNVLHRYCQKVNESRNCSLSLPTELDWIVANQCMNFFAIFGSTTKICSGVYSPTSNKVINSLLDIFATFKAYHFLDTFKPALIVMKLKFEKYWAEFPMIFCLATVMDPRFKLLAIKSWLSQYDLSDTEVHLKVEQVKVLLYQLYGMYKKASIVAASSSLVVDSSSSNVVLNNSLDADIPFVPSASMTSLKRARVSNIGALTDLQMYLEHDTVEVDENNSFNVLIWWKTNSCMYPVLSNMAKDILSIPASTVASEAAFSAGGRVVSEKRASLSPNTIEALICLKDWSLATCRKQEAAAEEAVAKELMNAHTSRPDWLAEESIELEEEVISEANYATLPHVVDDNTNA